MTDAYVPAPQRPHLASGDVEARVCGIGRFVMLEGGFDDAGCKVAVMMVRRKSGAAMSKDRSLLQNG